MPAAALSIKQLKEWYQSHQKEILNDFFTFLKFPSISTDPQFKEQTHQTADWLCDYIREIGLEVELWETPGHPVVFGTYMKAGKERPTLLIYHHYDVQPVDPLELWKTPPFEPAIRENQVYARGAVDNKGQCFYSLTALKACLSLAKELNVNLKLFIEGEEESGSSGTSAILKQKKDALKADYLLVVDFDIPSVSSPGVTVGMRGLLAMEVECENSSIDLHSGTHGGVALNPNRALATLLAKMWDEKGRVAIPGFYEDVEPLSKEVLSKVDMSFDQESYQKRFGVQAFCPEEGFSLKESNGLRPVLEINGMSGGYTGPGFKTVIPAKAQAKLSCRLVPHQDPEKIFRAIKNYFEKNVPKGLKIKVTSKGGAPSYRSSLNSSIVKTVNFAYEEVFGKPSQYLFCGASVPIIVELAKASQAEVAMMGVGLAEDDIHAPNEHFGLDRFELGYLTMGRILSRLSSL